MRTEKLNLVMTYPVNWSAFMVFRDYIQNFYDALGYEQFGKTFFHSYQEDTQTLVLHSSRAFSMDWLMYIGVSSKRDDDTSMQIGRFGEGFKIASLAAFRDFHWKITMESQDWRLRVTQMPVAIDGNEVYVLAYEIENRPEQEDATLTLQGVNPKFMDAFSRALGDFYYEENPNFGDVLVKKEDYAIYRPSETGFFTREGALFAGLLNRGLLRFPLIICCHTYHVERDGRERENYLDQDICRCVEHVFYKLDAWDAYQVLLIMAGFWSRFGRPTRRCPDYKNSIRILIGRIQTSDLALAQFQKAHGDSLLADFPETDHSSRKKLAQKWFYSSHECQNRSLVLHEFLRLGISELDSFCEENGGYQTNRTANPTEEQYIALLRQIALEVFDGFTCYDRLPDCRIFENRPPYSGLANCIASARKERNRFGMSLRYDIPVIYLHARLFDHEHFSEAVSVYMHELLHQFGGDGSAQFRQAIREMSLRMIRDAERLMPYKLAWEEI